jgi:hypothetical protein
MTHPQFIASFQNGAIGCGVRTPQALALIFSGKVERPIVMRVLGFLSSVSAGFIMSCVLLFLYAPPIWAIIGFILPFSISCLVVTLGVGELVTKFAFSPGPFFGLAMERRALLVWNDQDEGNSPMVEIEGYPEAKKYA